MAVYRSTWDYIASISGNSGGGGELSVRMFQVDLDDDAVLVLSF